MKKPTAYLPFYGNDFFQAMAGHSDAVGMGYLRAIWHYWSHTGCEGLPDEDDYLRRICDCQAAEWPSIKGIVFDNRYHFRLEHGAWHQPRCREEWTKSKRAFDQRSAIGKAAAMKRWEKE